MSQQHNPFIFCSIRNGKDIHVRTTPLYYTNHISFPAVIHITNFNVPAKATAIISTNPPGLIRFPVSSSKALNYGPASSAQSSLALRTRRRRPSGRGLRVVPHPFTRVATKKDEEGGVARRRGGNIQLLVLPRIDDGRRLCQDCHPISGPRFSSDPTLECNKRG
ncbi:hypothetical protein PpBr36_03063 [Pyricularia pennisetigena]|uniref:hypothetical protein n=1 Tax=Pyricularia pennisetigena TaxID=1578925 RepID=UPI00114F816E|nr:hypothetical protein PpBr36_03063 [Pyricularia pennisetigena]TLS30990.1 hypothetical protein PpBr36_03063 [Pyricularia pennisetigena]